MNKRSKTGFPSILKATLVLSAYLILIAIKGCNSGDHQQQDPIDLYQYNNPAPDFFFDQGSWFGIQLPEGGKAGIAAPLILSDSNGYRFREPIIGLSVSEGDLPAPFKTANFNLPGRLVQILDTNGLEVLITTIFADHQTAIQQINISNISGSNKKISLELNFPRPDSTNNNRLWFYDLGNAQLLLETESELFPLENICQLQIIIQPEGKFSTYLAIRHRFKGDKAFDPYDFDGSANDLIENEKRWKGYILPYINLDSKKQCLAVKCIQTLINNWRSAAGELRHAGLFPSYAYRGFHGFWAWDSWKHAVALATFEPTLAKDQIRAMYDFQDDAGMIADCIFRDTIIENHNWRNTKPPLSAWAVFKVFEKTGDTGFVKEMLPKLVKYHAWWYKNRDHNNNSLCEYGSTDGTRIAAAWESGMDNAVRFDSASLVKINQSAWSLDQESVYLNAFLYAEKMYLSRLAKVVNDKALHEKYNSQLPALKNRIQTYFYDSVSGY
nr:hypothetical protein [Bacteroidota bacterium]